jgi:hypothetical protein
MDDILGRVVEVAGSRITVKLEANYGDECPIGIETIVKVRHHSRLTVAAVSEVQFDDGSLSKRKLVAELLGELLPTEEVDQDSVGGYHGIRIRVRPF